MCLGHFYPKEWDFNYETELVDHWPDASIKILYRDKIKVFYSTVNIAKKDGYTQFSDIVFSKKNGYVYSYTGLRGDAKRLYYRITQNTEKKVAVIKTPSIKD